MRVIKLLSQIQFVVELFKQEQSIEPQVGKLLVKRGKVVDRTGSPLQYVIEKSAGFVIWLREQSIETVTEKFEDRHMLEFDERHAFIVT